LFAYFPVFPYLEIYTLFCICLFKDILGKLIALLTNVAASSNRLAPISSRSFSHTWHTRFYVGNFRRTENSLRQTLSKWIGQNCTVETCLKILRRKSHAASLLDRLGWKRITRHARSNAISIKFQWLRNARRYNWAWIFRCKK